VDLVGWPPKELPDEVLIDLNVFEGEGEIQGCFNKYTIKS
jgi:hypothetical protein